MKLLPLPTRQVLMAAMVLFILDFLAPPWRSLRICSLLLTAALTLAFLAENLAAARAAGPERLAAHARQRWLDLGLLVVLILFATEKILVGTTPVPEGGATAHHRAFVLYATIVLCLSLAKTATREKAAITFLTSLRMRPPHTMLVAYGLGTLVGTLLLCLPQAVTSLEAVNLTDAWFTATSAICVTGLVVNDVGTTYSGFGQLVIMALIQAGGLGIMFFAAFLVMLGTQGLGARRAEDLREMMDTDPGRSVPALVKRLFIFSLTIEAAGAVWLTLSFLPDHGSNRAMWLGAFHAVSAFCNAGFCLFPNNLGGFVGSWSVCAAVVGMAVLGGLGIPVLDDLLEGARSAWRGRGARRISLHSRFVLWASAICLVAGAVMFFVLEFGGILAPLPFPDKLLASVFHSAAGRTAGFSSLDLSACQPSTALGMIVLMFIGGAPVSTAGGLKVTTVALLFLAVRATVLNHESIFAFNRRVPEPVVHKAIALLAIGFSLFVAILGLLLVVEPAEPFLLVLFEAASAFNTVGWSLGQTAALSGAGKFVVILAMLIGRIGPLTLAVALAAQPRAARFTYPPERVLIG